MSRNKVLAAFRALHRARKEIFKGDALALSAGRSKINEEFKKNASETDSNKITELLKVAEDSEKFLRKTVVQGVEKPDGSYEVRITRDTALEKNTIFDPNAKLPERGRKKKCTDTMD